MSTIFRKTLICLVAVFAIGAVAASAASAFSPPTELGVCEKVAAGTGEYTDANCSTAGKGNFKFVRGTKNKFTVSGAAGKLSVAGTSVTCKQNKGSGEVTGFESFAKVVSTFEECEVEVGGKKEPIANITTKNLKGAAGEIAKAEATSESGILLEPETGTEFATIPATKISPETKVTGSVAGELGPLTNAKEQTLVFALSAGKQKIKTINVEDVVKKPSLKAFGLAATEETTQKIVYEENLWLIGGDIGEE